MVNPQLQDYINQSRKNGISDEQIRQSILGSGSGWTEEDVNVAMSAGQNPVPQNPAPIPTPTTTPNITPSPTPMPVTPMSTLTSMQPASPVNTRGHAFRKIIFGLILLLVAVGGSLVYARNAGYISIFLFPQEKEQREVQRLSKLFPDQLGDYAVFLQNSGKIGINDTCNNIENSGDGKASGLSGEICSRVVSVEYRQTQGNKRILIGLAQSSKGSEITKAFYEKVSQPDILYGYNILRNEEHRIVWFPASQFDYIIMQEEISKVDPGDGREHYFSYKSGDAGDNAVTNYFLDKFSPLNK